MRRIDLFCKLIGPIAIAFANGISPKIAISLTGFTTTILVFVEYFTVAKVYTAVPALRAPRMSHRSTPRGRRSMMDRIKSSFTSTAAYARHPVFLPSFSLALLYLTVLSFNGQMITYLIALGMSSGLIGVLRGIAAVFELSATWLGPKVMAGIGPLRTGEHNSPSQP